MAQLPGFEAIGEPKEDGVEEGPKIAKFKAEDLDRNLMNKQAQDILKVNEYHKLPSEYLEEDVSTIDKVIDDVNDDLEITSQAIKNTAIFTRDPNGYLLAKPVSKKPHENTINFINKYNILSIYATNLSNLKYYKTKSGSGIVYFNNGSKLPNITNSIDVLNINTSAITDSIVNGINTNTIAVIPTDNLTRSYPFTFEPKRPLYCSVSSFNIAEMRIYVTDSLGRPVNFNGIDWFMTLILHSM